MRLAFVPSSALSHQGPSLFMSAKAVEIHAFIIDERSSVLMFVRYKKRIWGLKGGGGFRNVYFVV
jgi:hypothetical protein